MFTALTRATAAWRIVVIGKLELRQLTGLRRQLNSPSVKIPNQKILPGFASQIFHQSEDLTALSFMTILVCV